MKIKSLLLGSAAALVAVSGARAADAVIIPEPEVVEYVRVCDAAGTGFFYIPGTETCLKIGGYARFQIDHRSWDSEVFDNDDAQWGLADPDIDDETYGDATFASKLSLKVSSWTDSEIGAIETFYEAVATSGGSLAMDSMYLSFAGLKMGYFGGYLDNGINGETDNNGLRNKFDSIQYNGTAGAVSFGVSIDEIDTDVWNDWEGATFGVTGMIGFSAGAIDATLVGFYDIDQESGGIVGRVSADLGMGTLQFRGTWAENAWNHYVMNAESPDDDGALNYVLEASYAAAVSDKLTLTPGFSYVKWYSDGIGNDGGDRMWTAGLTADYAITDTLAIKAHVEYWDFHDSARAGQGAPNLVENDGTGWRNFLRIQASF